MFELDPFQKEAIDAIDEGKSVLISAPTGAGKTCIAEAAIERCMENNRDAIYTAPVKALSNQKYRDFRAKYGEEKVGIVTGDVTINGHAPLLIMTTEIYRNRLFEKDQRLRDLSYVIFDEIHYIDDAQRGTVWEEAIMFSPEHVSFIGLSATIPNIQELADWIQSIHPKELKVIIEKNRPVPLNHIFQCQGRLMHSFKTLRKKGFLNSPDWSHFRKPRWMQHSKKHRRVWMESQKYKAKPNSIQTIIEHLEQHDGYPCIYFVFARRRAELLADEISKQNFLSNNEREKALNLFDELTEKYDIHQESTIQLLRTFVSQGIAFHHAGMLPTTKEVIERLFTEKLIKMIFTTETFAIGINMPAKTVIFDELRKFHGTHFGPLRTRDYFQMAGRAGRRGIDLEGYVISRINPFDVSFLEIQRMIKSNPEPVQSQFNAAYATLLNLYRNYGEKLFDIYPRSFHYYQASGRLRKRAVSSLHRKIELLKHLGYIQDEQLTEKGEFASCMYGYELPISEMLMDGYLDELTDIDLNIIICALVYEPRKKQEEPPFNTHIEELIYHVDPYLYEINKLEKKAKIFPETKDAFFHLAPAIVAWCKGQSLQQLEHFTSADEGEIVRYFRMVVQLLRIIRTAPGVSENMKKKAHFAIEKLNRDEIDAEKQLRV